MIHIKRFLAGLGILLGAAAPFFIGWGVARSFGMSEDDGAPLMGVVPYFFIVLILMAYGIGRDLVFRDD